MANNSAPWEDYAKPAESDAGQPWEDYAKPAEAKPSQPTPEQPKEPTFGERLATGYEGFKKGVKEGVGAVVEPLAHLATGAIAKPVSDIAGLAAIPLHAAGLTPGGRTPEEIQQTVGEALTYEPRTEAGRSEYNPLNRVPQLLSGVIQKVTPEKAAPGEAGTVSGMLRNAASEAIPQALSIGLGKFAPKAAVPLKKTQEIAQAGAKKLMQSAIKPSQKALKSGDAAIAIDTMLEGGYSATPKGVEQIRARIDDLNDQVKKKIASFPENIQLQKVARPVVEQLRKLREQVNPGADIKAIKDAWKEFRNHPLLTPGATEMPVQLAQKLKTGTYRELAKKYGTPGTAEVKGQKALARGLKEQIAAKVPEIEGLNKEESRLLKTLSVAESRILQHANKNPFGLSLLAKDPAAWAAFMADRSASFKSLLAKVIYTQSKKVGTPSQKKAITAGTKAAAATAPYSLQESLKKEQETPEEETP